MFRVACRLPTGPCCLYIKINKQGEGLLWITKVPPMTGDVLNPISFGNAPAVRRFKFHGE